MEWVKEFYNNQILWSKEAYDFENVDPYEELVEKAEKFCETTPKNILELGGGSGHFAVAAAKNGYQVTVIELAPAAVEIMKKLIEKHGVQDRVRIIEGDFYQVQLDDSFDLICYWDGFGIGTDADQQKLLSRVQNWLKSDGVALIDIYTPWYWAKTAGQEMNFGNISRVYQFDAYESRMLDIWWKNHGKETKITQSLRCYSPADLILLIKDLGLTLVHCESGGAMDYENGKYLGQVPLHEAMSYMAKFKKE